MGSVQTSNQFTIAGLLFVAVGAALCCWLVPHIYAAPGMSPPWSVFAVIALMFAWAMIPLRHGPARAWWIGFLVFGCLYLAIAIPSVPRIVPLLGSRFSEPVLVTGILAVSLALLLGLAFCGGAVAARLHASITRAAVMRKEQRDP